MLQPVANIEPKVSIAIIKLRMSALERLGCLLCLYRYTDKSLSNLKKAGSERLYWWYTRTCYNTLYECTGNLHE